MPEEAKGSDASSVAYCGAELISIQTIHSQSECDKRLTKTWSSCGFRQLIVIEKVGNHEVVW